MIYLVAVQYWGIDSNALPEFRERNMEVHSDSKSGARQLARDALVANMMRVKHIGKAVLL